jgi:hypothetical protein
MHSTHPKLNLCPAHTHFLKEPLIFLPLCVGDLLVLEERAIHNLPYLSYHICIFVTDSLVCGVECNHR